MQTEVLQEFLAIADLLSFRKAAEELHITQPALSKHIAALERELGFRLFDRTGSTRLTPEGTRFLVYAQQILNTIEEAKARCPGASGHAPVKVPFHTEESLLFNDVLPRIRTPFSLVEVDSADSSLLDLLLGGTVDVMLQCNVADIDGLAAELGQAGCAFFEIGASRMALLVSRDGQLASKDRLSRADLEDAVIYLEHGPAHENQIDAARAILGQDLRLKFVQDPLLFKKHATIALYNPGQGVIFASDRLLGEARRKRSDLVMFDELDGEPILAKEYLVYRAGDPNPNVRAFVQEVATLTQAASGDGAAPGGGGAPGGGWSARDDDQQDDA